MVFDLTDLDHPQKWRYTKQRPRRQTTTNTPHGEWLFQSNYRAGLRMLSDAWPQSMSDGTRIF